MTVPALLPPEQPPRDTKGNWDWARWWDWLRQVAHWAYPTKEDHLAFRQEYGEWLSQTLERDRHLDRWKHDMEERMEAQEAKGHVDDIAFTKFKVEILATVKTSIAWASAIATIVALAVSVVAMVIR